MEATSGVSTQYQTQMYQQMQLTGLKKAMDNDKTMANQIVSAIEKSGNNAPPSKSPSHKGQTIDMYV